jgi:hypothetical protein
MDSAVISEESKFALLSQLIGSRHYNISVDLRELPLDDSQEYSITFCRQKRKPTDQKYVNVSLKSS